MAIAENLGGQKLNCPVCQAHVTEGSRSSDILQRCPACGFLFSPFIPPDAEILRLYQTPYFLGDEYVDYLRDRPVLQRNFRLRIKTLRRYSSGGRLYEIGAAYGFFLDLARVHWEVEGIDVAEDACRYAREALKLNVKCGDFLEASLEPEAYDVFCMWDTIEHLREPDRYVEKVALCLRRGGHLALTTGDIASIPARLQGRRWRLIHPPTHLYYFSPSTIRRLLDRYGLELIYLSHPGFYRSLETMLKRVLLSLGSNGAQLYAKFKDTKWARSGIYLNMHDIMFAVARKRDPEALKLL